MLDFNLRTFTQMDLHEANMRAGGPGQKPSPGQLGSPHEVNNLKQQLADAKSKIEGLEKALDEKQKQIVELEGKLKVTKDDCLLLCSNGLQMQITQIPN